MKTLMKGLALAVALTAPCGSALCETDVPVEFQQDIRELMKITGAEDLAVQMMRQLIGPMRQSMPDVPDEFWTGFMAKVDTAELVDLIIPIYAKHFTHEEIKELVAFYRTPAGRKMIATLPAVVQETMIAGQSWGERIAKQVQDELAAGGFQ